MIAFTSFQCTLLLSASFLLLACLDKCKKVSIKIGSIHESYFTYYIHVDIPAGTEHQNNLQNNDLAKEPRQGTSAELSQSDLCNSSLVTMTGLLGAKGHYSAIHGWQQLLLFAPKITTSNLHLTIHNRKTSTTLP
jgi:hypothetical protein